MLKPVNLYFVLMFLVAMVGINNPEFYPSYYAVLYWTVAFGIVREIRLYNEKDDELKEE